jgi:type II secretory pathway pseudopilin PulG
MKTCHRNGAVSQRRFPGLRAFTLTEIMVAMTVLMLVIAGVLTTHLFGLRMVEISKAKLGASDDARQAISLIISEVRSARTVRVGQGDLTSFTEVPMNTLQQGSSIQVYPTLDTNQFIRYFWDVADQRLKRTTNGATAAWVVANAITNSVLFRGEDYQGNATTNNQNNRVIALTLQFYQLMYPRVNIGPGNYYDFYQLRTRITPRTLQ